MGDRAEGPKSRDGGCCRRGVEGVVSRQCRMLIIAASHVDYIAGRVDITRT